MDELSEEDRLTVARARKIQRFLSQPFQVAEVFTGHMGKLVPLKETIKGFQSILAGWFSRSRELQTMFLHCAPELLWLHLQFSCCLFCPRFPTGEYDALPEQAFYMVGPIEEVVQKAEKLAEEHS